MMYFGVLAIAFTGALIARFEPKATARAMFAAAGAQILVPLIALSAGAVETDLGWPWDIVILTGFFSALWTASAVLFQKAAEHARLQAGTGSVI